MAARTIRLLRIVRKRRNLIMCSVVAPVIVQNLALLGVRIGADNECNQGW